jgi:hypothetical protein
MIIISKNPTSDKINNIIAPPSKYFDAEIHKQTATENTVLSFTKNKDVDEKTFLFLPIKAEN